MFYFLDDDTPFFSSHAHFFPQAIKEQPLLFCFGETDLKEKFAKPVSLAKEVIIHIWHGNMRLSEADDCWDKISRTGRIQNKKFKMRGKILKSTDTS
jgi:hypothetical protein